MTLTYLFQSNELQIKEVGGCFVSKGLLGIPKYLIQFLKILSEKLCRR